MTGASSQGRCRDLRATRVPRTTRRTIHTHMTTLTESNVRLFASPRSWIESNAVDQLCATASLEGMRSVAGFPDLHSGKGGPVGAAFVTDGMLYPHLIGGDIGCGMAFFSTDLLRRKAKLDRWAELPFDLENPWQ